MGQKPVPPVTVSIRTKIGSTLVASPTNQNRIPHRFDHHSHCMELHAFLASLAQAVAVQNLAASEAPVRGVGRLYWQSGWSISCQLVLQMTVVVKTVLGSRFGW